MGSKTTINLYSQLYQQIVDKCLQEYDGKFQLVYPFIDYGWKAAPPGYINPIVYITLGRIPSWSTIAEVKADLYALSGTMLYSAYISMLLNCPKLTITPDQKEELQKVQQQIDTAMKAFQNDDKQMYTTWNIVKENPPAGQPPPVFNKWIVQSGWQKKLDTDHAAIHTAIKNKNKLVAQQNPKYKATIEASTLPESLTTKKPGFVKLYGLDSWCANIIIGKSSSVLPAPKFQDGGISFQMESLKPSIAMDISWGAEGIYISNNDFHFFSAFVNGSWEIMDLNTEHDPVNVDLEIKNIMYVPVQPDPAWYNSDYLKQLAEKDYWNNPFTTTGGKSPVFGKDGLLPLMITGMIIGSDIKFSIEMSASTFTQYVKCFTAADGIRIGPIHIGGGSSGSTLSSKLAENNMFIGESAKTDSPFIIGFTVAEPGLT